MGSFMEKISRTGLVLAVLVVHWRRLSARIRRAREAAPGPDLD